MIYVLSIVVFACALAIKGGWLGFVFKNWNALTDTIEARFRNAVEEVVLGFKDGDFSSRLFWVSLLKLPFQGATKWFMDGSIISVFIILVFSMASMADPGQALLFTGGWALILSSVGEEAGAAGDYQGGWGEYVTHKENPDGTKAFGRLYGIKKGIQYGAFAGGVMAFAAQSFSLWIAGALFPLVYFIGSSAGLYFTGKRGWRYAEPLWGAVFGLAYAMSINGIMGI